MGVSISKVSESVGISKNGSQELQESESVRVRKCESQEVREYGGEGVHK